MKLVASTTDINEGATLGQIFVGTWIYDSYATMCHKDFIADASAYAFIQNDDGATFFNSEIGQSLYFNIGANNKWQILSTGDFWTDSENLLMDGDNLKIQLGETLTDLELYSDGTNGVIDTTGDLIIGNNLNVSGNFTGNQIYGEMWYHNHTATELDFAVDGAYYNLTFNNSLVNGFTFDDAGDYLESGYDGVYKASYMASGDGQNNHVYFTSVTVNAVVVDKCESHKKMSAGSDIVTMTGDCFIELTAGDKIRLATADVGATGTGNYYSASLNLVRIGD